MTAARMDWKVFLSPRMWLAGLMGFASGLPLLLTLSVLQAWLKAEGVDLATIGFIGLVGLPYTLKFLWAPLFDRYVPLDLGRRRGWLVIFQVLLAAGIAGLGLTAPAERRLLMMRALAPMVIQRRSDVPGVIVALAES